MIHSTPSLRTSHVSKRFCRDLKRSLRYGVRDLTRELSGSRPAGIDRLRPGEFLALNDVSFELEEGECLGLLGANGAGKSTLLKMLNGLVRPDAGSIRIQGRVRALIELGIGFNPILTGRENVYVNGAVLGFSKKEIDAKFDNIVNFAELQHAIDAPVQSYSSGMHVRLAMAVAANLDAEFLLVDEVLAVGDTAFRMKCFEHFLAQKKCGRSIILVSHNMIDINRVCDRVLVIDKGKKVFDGDVSAGIAAYESILLAKSGEIHRREDDAPAWIEAAAMQDASGVPRSEFSTGDDVVVDVKLSSTERISDARLIVHVISPSVGVLGSFASPHAQFSFEILPSGSKIRFVMPKIPLLVGSYSMTLSLYGPGVKDFYHSMTNAVSFNIVAPAVDTFGFGVCHAVYFEHRWELSDESNGRRLSAVGGAHS